MTENKQIIAAEPLDQETIDKIKDGLLVRRQQIKEELKKITTADNKNDEPVKAKFPNYGNESDDNALEISDYTTNLATEKKDKPLIFLIGRRMARAKDLLALWMRN